MQSVAQGGTYVVKAHNGLLPSGSLERLQAQVWPGVVSPNHIAWIWGWVQVFNQQTWRFQPTWGYFMDIYILYILIYGIYIYTYGMLWVYKN